MTQVKFQKLRLKKKYMKTDKYYFKVLPIKP